MKMSFRAVCATAASAGVLLAGAAMAQASTSYSSYNTTIGNFGGAGYSGTQTKTITDADANVRSSTVGGNYTADVCLAIPNGSACIGGTKTINDGTNVSLWNYGAAGLQHRLKFTDGWQLVNVQVTGTWRSN